MATYKQIQEHIKSKYQITAQSCWIAHVKSDYGLTAHSNRQGERVKPCPDRHRQKIEDALRHFKMIP